MQKDASAAVDRALAGDSFVAMVRGRVAAKVKEIETRRVDPGSREDRARLLAEVKEKNARLTKRDDVAELRRAIKDSKYQALPESSELADLLEDIQTAAGAFSDEERTGLRTAAADSLKWAMGFPKESCTQLYKSKWWSLILVSLIVAAGLVFGAMQLLSSANLASRTLALEEKALGDTAVLRILVQGRVSGDTSTQTNMTFENGKVSVQTSFAGLAVLVLSLVFYFLYLKFVFPKDVPEVGKEPKPAPPAEPGS
jgi:hypothetical protein